MSAIKNKIYSQIAPEDFVFLCDDFADKVLLAHDVVTSPQERITRIKYHVKHGDYFSTLAAILKILSTDKKVQKETALQKLSSDLEFLQENFKIVEK